MADEEASETVVARRKPFYRRITLSMSAFMMSLTVTLLSTYYGLRGAEIVVQTPEQVLIYRDGEGDRSVLTFVVRLPMINAAADYGDLMLEANLRPGPQAPWFKYQALVQPVFTDKALKAIDKCDLEARCIARPGLFVTERSDEILDIPAGAARSRYFAFTLAEWNCTGSKPACGAFKNYAASAARIGSRPLDVEIEVRFHGDGKRRIHCLGGKIDTRYLDQIGWVSLACETRSVEGGGFL
jgi:hypothetical protein